MDAAAGGPALDGMVIAVAGAAGPAGRAAVLRLAAAGATVAAADADAARLKEVVDAAASAGSAKVTGETVDLLDADAARAWADGLEKEHGAVHGLVHLVGGWRGSKSFTGTDLADWDLLEKLLIRTAQHTSLAFHDALLRSGRGRFAIVSAAGATKPTAGNAAYGAAKAAAEAWTLALGDSFRKAAKAGGDAEPRAAAAILVIKALVHDAMRAERPDAKFAGFTDVKDLAEAIAGLWDRPAQEVNGHRLWLTPEPNRP
ncbi:SDR family NAD(P)-dependent oxidoreductase [Streptomyces montanisoli]|uniref:SDR family NAD(P)-dependent oxidoreductase n=1 Tax=Streptomyces montanisoli TaxID=2798581 RepID=A0A940MJ63_9ACTN|nr:SDR family NAD(P)-dependent oxidoreductase [Streptomyces montanisoli]MBP0460261.1 SDR family NAD(P)-dependent oxidoreductase [Streptomyces montanisoli]